ncbi:RNA polymerase sigma factor [Spirosoma knui]
MARRCKDEQLATRYQQSVENDGFEALYQRYAQKVYQKCLSMTQDDEAAQDLTQDIFIKVFNKLDSFQHRSTFSTWLYSITHHHCLDQLRIGKRMLTESLSEDLQNQCPDAISVDDVANCEERHGELEAVVNSLPADELALLKLKYEQNLSVKELAQQYGLSESAVKMRLKRTRDRLQQVYIAQYGK